MKVLFFALKSRLLKNGEAPIILRVTIDGQSEDARIQRSVPLKMWNNVKGCSKGSACKITIPVKRRRLELPRHNCHYPLKVARLPIPDRKSVV